MKKLINLTAILLILAGGLASCKDKEENISLEMGLYIEVKPIRTPQEMGHPTIDFIDKERLVITKYASQISVEYLYEIRKNTIRLTPKEYPETVTEPYFRIINHRKFEIGYLYVTHGLGGQPDPMAFEKNK